jgi:hypothetical protein
VQASIQAYVTDGVITEEELENCTPDQLEFLIRKRSPQPADAQQGQRNVVPWSSPSKVSLLSAFRCGWRVCWRVLKAGADVHCQTACNA